MLPVIVATIVLLLLAVNNAYEFSLVYKVHKGEANMVDAHSRIVESAELVGFILASILLYISALDTIAVVVLVAVGLFHLSGALTSKQSLSKFSQKTLLRLNKVIMIATSTEVVVAGGIVVWMASNGWIVL